jgi:hypothetical protein
MNPRSPEIQPPGADAFLEAAWAHAREFITAKGYVPDVMLLGRYSDEELMFVFPSTQDRADFQRACIAEAAAFGADIAMLVGEASIGAGGPQHEIVAVRWRERGHPARAQFAPLMREPQMMLGPVSSLPGTQENAFLEMIFGATVN